MKILVINCGSSSIKYSLFDGRTMEPLASGLVEKIGEPTSRVKHKTLGFGISDFGLRNDPPKEGNSAFRIPNSEFGQIPDHRRGLALMVELLMDGEIGVIESPEEISAIGHRVVHGGERFSQPAIITEEVKEAIEALIPLAPLHNPANLTGIEVAQELFPAAPQVAVFDTAFHQTIPANAYRYAVPTRLYEEHGVRVYGFHGTSHLYVSKQAGAYLEAIYKIAPHDANLITAHLGNGCSITAVKGGQSVDTSMGFSPLAGLIMGTRSGDVDPALPYFLGTSLGMSFEQIDRLLNKQSGMLGLTGQNDLREIEERGAAGDPEAQLALEMYAYRIKKYIGAYMAALGRVDALVFTAGVGEHSDVVRRLACQGLEHWGIVLDEEKNRQGASQIRNSEFGIRNKAEWQAPTTPTASDAASARSDAVGGVTEIQAVASAVKILIIPTNEELEIASETRQVLTAD